jgi:hypothetical protein
MSMLMLESMTFMTSAPTPAKSPLPQAVARLISLLPVVATLLVATILVVRIGEPGRTIAM